MKIIFDTNVLLSAILFSGFSTKVFDYSIVRYNIITSDWLLEELEEKLIGKFKMNEDKAAEILDIFNERMAVIHPFNELPVVCRDIDDNNILQLADYMDVDYIITGDKDLLILEKYKKTKILNPREFHDLFIEIV